MSRAGGASLDLLRSAAVGLVVFSHVGTFLAWGGPGYDLGTMGRLGVAIFFVHTSLVLMLSLERHGPAPGPFFVRRAFRIYPLAVSIVLYEALARWLQGQPVDAWGVLANLLLVQNLTGHDSTPSPLWSLPYEVQMYLALPALFALARGGAARVGLAWACSLAIAAAAWAWGVRPLEYVACFLPGVLAYAIAPRVRPRLGPAMLFALVAAAALAVPALVARGWPELPLLWALCALLGLAIPLCRPIGPGPLAAAAKTVATYSYGVYLTHLAAINFAFYVLREQPAALQWAAFPAALALFSYEAYRWIEKPGIDLGIRLAGARAMRPQPD